MHCVTREAAWHIALGARALCRGGGRFLEFGEELGTVEHAGAAENDALLLVRGIQKGHRSRFFVSHAADHEDKNVLFGAHQASAGVTSANTTRLWSLFGR